MQIIPNGEYTTHDEIEFVDSLAERGKFAAIRTIHDQALIRRYDPGVNPAMVRHHCASLLAQVKSEQRIPTSHPAVMFP